jgi:type IV pilus assembly protein PilM
MAKNATTLYINDSSIRLLVTRGRRISKLASVPLETGLSDVDSPEKEAALVNKLKTLMHTNKISGRKVILGISGLHCLTRPVSLPELPKAMLREAVLREAQRVLPVPPEQLYISWQIISSAEGKLTAFMVAIPRQVADTLMRILHGAGLKAYLMDIKPLALARLARESTAIIVDMQPKEFDIVIMGNGLPQPIRTVPFPEEYRDIKDKAAIIRDELARTIQFHNSNNPEQPLPPQTKLYLSGEIADEPDLHEEMVHGLDLVPELLASPLKCAKHLDSSLHLANVGLVLKQLPKDAGPLLPNFNTLPEPYQPRQISTSKLMAVPATIAAVGLVVLLGMTVQDAAARLQNTKDQLDSTNLVLQKRQNEKNELTKTIGQLEKELSGIEDERDQFTEVLANIGATGEAINTDLTESTGAIVPGLDLAAAIHAGGHYSLSGVADSEREVIEFARQLRDTGLFKEVTIQSIHYSESEDSDVPPYSYAIALKLAEN